MTDEFINSAFIGMFLAGLAQLLILIGCIIIALKQRNTAGYILLIGIILMILISIGAVVWPMIAAREGSERLIEIQGTLSVLRGLAFLVFGIGLLLVATDLIGKRLKN